MAGKWDIIIHQNEDFQRLVTFKDSARATIDQTGYTYSGQIRKYAGAPGDPVAEFTFAIQNQTTNKGEVLISIPKEDTVLIPVDPSSEEIGLKTTKYVFDIWRTYPSGRKVPVFYGTATVFPRVST